MGWGGRVRGGGVGGGWCRVRGAWWVVCGVRCAAGGVRCAVCGVWCAVCGVWCAVCVVCVLCTNVSLQTMLGEYIYHQVIRYTTKTTLNHSRCEFGMNVDVAHKIIITI